MWNLNYEIREKYLVENEEVKKKWEIITTKKKSCNKDQSSIRKEIFDVLSKKNYDTSFETRQRDSYYQENYRYYHDTNFYSALKTIKTILEKKTLHNKTIDKIISFIDEIKAIKKALDTSSIQMKREELLTQKANLTPYYRDKDGIGRIDFFWEQEKAIDKELKALEKQENQESWRKKTEEKYDNNEEYEEEESRPGYRMDKD